MGDARGTNGVESMSNDAPLHKSRFITIPDTASYPTGSLDFLSKLKQDDLRSQTYDTGAERPSSVQLNIIIVGAGLGGLSAGIALARKGHKVRVIEQAPVLGEVRLPS
jgi:hypothetical protein